MKKLKLEELGRVSVEEFRGKQKLPVVVVLDNIRSMHNTGSVFRTADAFAVEKVFLCGITGRPPHREIQKTALGATESVDWTYFADARGALDKLKEEGYFIAGIEQTSRSIYLHEFSFEKGKKYALIFGNEVSGLSEEILPLLDAAIEIPQAGTKHSLNVSVSSAVVLWEIFRKGF